LVRAAGAETQWSDRDLRASEKRVQGWDVGTYYDPGNRRKGLRAAAHDPDRGLRSPGPQLRRDRIVEPPRRVAVGRVRHVAREDHVDVAFFDARRLPRNLDAVRNDVQRGRRREEFRVER